MRKKIAVIGVFVAMLLVSCAALNTKPNLTPKEKAVVMMAAYQFVYGDYQRQAARSDLTEPEKAMLRTKKDLLEQVYPIIGLYNEYVMEGESAGVLAQLEFQITVLLNQLESTLIKKLM